MEELIEKHCEEIMKGRYDQARDRPGVVDEWEPGYEVEPGTHPAFLYQQGTMRDRAAGCSAAGYFQQARGPGGDGQPGADGKCNSFHYPDRRRQDV